MNEIRQAAIEDFGQPSYQYENIYGHYYSYWFGHMLLLNSDCMFTRLKVKRKYWIFGEKVLYFYDTLEHGNEGWIKCRANVQAKWESHGVDNIILGDNCG